MPDPVAIILLAAGGSVRMGASKQLLPFRGRTVLYHAAKTAVGSGCAPVIVVLGDRADECRAELEDLPVSIVVNAAWQRGMGSSLRTGVEYALQLEPSLTAGIIQLCDQPLVDPRSLQALLEGYRQTGRPLIVSRYADTFGPPALIAGDYFKRLSIWSDDQAGAKALFGQALPDDILPIPLADAASDLDTPDDYRKLSDV